MSTDDDFMEISTFNSSFSHISARILWWSPPHRIVVIIDRVKCISISISAGQRASRRVFGLTFEWAENQPPLTVHPVCLNLFPLFHSSPSYATAEYRPVCRLCRGCGWVTRIWNSRIVLQKQAQQQNSSDHSFVSFQWNGKSFSFVKKYTSTMTFQIEFRLQVAWVCILKLRHATHSECMLYAINDYREDTNADTIIVIIEPNQTETPS